MQIVYLRAAIADLIWLRTYYSRIFPEGDKRAREQFRAVERLVAEHPNIGKALEFPGVREFVIPKTPFSIIYRVAARRIEVLRVWDNRSDRSALAPDG